MRFSTVFAALLSAGAALAQGNLINVVVGNRGELTFTPNLVNASVGDTIQFIFASKNHSATQSTFANPCTALAGGFDTGFNPTSSSVTTDSFPGNNSALPAWNFSVTSTSAPLWFFCAQTNPKDHCAAGMVFAINPPTSGNKTFDAFLQAALAQGSSPSSVSTSSIASTSPTSISSGVSTSIISTTPSSSTTLSSIVTSSSAPTLSSTFLSEIATSTSSSSATASASPSSSAAASSASSSSAPSASASSAAQAVRAGAADALLAGVGLLVLMF